MSDKLISPLNEPTEREKVNLTSRRKWLWVAVIVTIISPLAGFVLAIAFWTEPALKKEGRFLILLAVSLGVATVFLSRWLTERGYFPSGSFVS